MEHLASLYGWLRRNPLVIIALVVVGALAYPATVGSQERNTTVSLKRGGEPQSTIFINTLALLANIIISL